MKLWITGAAGLLGTALKRVCDERGIVYAATERAEVDVTDSLAVMRFVEAVRPTHIVNCAAYTAVDLAETEQPINISFPCYMSRRILSSMARKRRLMLKTLQQIL
jgi:dTDP-4-dehydrorhamnose reductase